MSPPWWGGWLPAVLSAAVAGLGLLRLLRPDRRVDRDVEASRVLMAVAMIAMLPPVGRALPWWCAVLLLADAAWLARTLLRRGAGDPHRAHRLHHLVGGVAMGYLVLVTALYPMAGMGMTGTGGTAGMVLLAVDLCLAIYLVAAAVHAAFELVPLPGAAPPALAGAAGGTERWPGAPRTAAGCQVAMNVAMLAMLFTML